MASEIIAAARDHAQRGLAVFPCRPGAKTPLQKWREASTCDPSIIGGWWAKSPKANIGIDCAKSGIVAIDVDHHDQTDGSATLSELERSLGPLPETWRAITGGGGEHIYFRAPPGRALRNSAGKLGPGVDVRGDGGYLVAPGSVHESGREYVWDAGAHPDDIPLADLPPTWLAALARSSTPAPVGGVSAAAEQDIPAGARNGTLTSHAGGLRRRGYAVEEIAALLLSVNARRCRPPLGEAEVCAIAGSVGRYAPVESLTAAPAPAFPLDALPDVMRAFVLGHATAIGCPPDFIAAPLLSACGAVLGNRWEVLVKAGWREYPVIWSGIVAPSGTAKSAAISAALGPLYGLQEEAHASWQTAMETYRHDLAAWEGAPKEKRDARPVEPAMQHLFTTDATSEMIAKIVEGSAGVALVQDELPGFIGRMDQYKARGGADRQTWLALWSGEALKVDRLSSGTIYVPHPVVCVTGGVQPARVRAFADEVAQEDGFAQRFLFAVPDCGPLDDTDAEPDPATIERLTSRLRLLRLSGVTVTLDDPARALRRRFSKNANQLAFAGGALGGFHAKASRHVARLALVLHALGQDDPAEPMTAATLAAAITIWEYFIAHMARVLVLAGPGRGSAADCKAKLLDALRSAHPGDLTGRELHAALGRHAKADALALALAELDAEGLAEPIETPGGNGGRPADRWRAIL